MEDRSINAQGSITGAVNTGDNSHVSSSIYQGHKIDLAVFARTLLFELSKRYPHQNPCSGAQQPCNGQQVLSPVAAYQITSVLTDNPFVSVPLETVRGWLEAGE